MIEAFINTLEFFPRGLVYVALGLVVLVLAKFSKDLITRYRIDQEVIQKGNLAIAVGLSGYFLGVVLVFLGAVYQPLTFDVSDGLGFDRAFAEDVLRVFLYSLAGIVALNIAYFVMDRLVLYKFSVEKEMVEDRNVGTGAVEFGMNVAIGLVIAGSISGEGVGSDISLALTSLAFFGMGLAVLIAFALFYDLTTPFSIHDEIEKDNAAVGIALGGNLIAMGIVILKAVFGDFPGWGAGITEFLIFAVLGFALLYVLRLLIDLLLLPTAKISNQLAVERNVGVAFIEGSVVIGSALILLFAI
jgi:uncharacterized membrane protein YjfL (UPF0719 family)